MKSAITTAALILGSLFAPVAVAAAPLVCSGPTGLVYVLSASCAASNVGVFPGFTVGNCLVVQSDFSLGGGACGGGGGSNFPTGITTGVPGVDGPFAIVSSSSGPVTFNTVGGDLNISDSSNGRIFLMDNAGNSEFIGQLQMDVGYNDTSGKSFGNTLTLLGGSVYPGSPALEAGVVLAHNQVNQPANTWAFKATLVAGTVTFTYPRTYGFEPVVACTPEGAGAGLISTSITTSATAVTSSNGADTRTVDCIIIGNGG